MMHSLPYTIQWPATSRLTSFGLASKLNFEEKRLTAQVEVFKFFSKSIASYIFERGSILLGTGSKYRRIESKSRVDPKEMSAALHVQRFQNDPLNRQLETSGVGKFIRNSGAGFSSNVQLEIADLTIVSQYDFFVYCFSYECSPQVAASFTDDANCVGKISNIWILAERLVKFHPDLQGHCYCIYPVIYTDQVKTRHGDILNPFDTAFEKDPAFAQNKEGRIVFYKVKPGTTQPVWEGKFLPEPKPFEHSSITSLFSPWPHPLQAD